MSNRPLDVLHSALGNKVNVELKGGRAFTGILDGYDHPHLNLVLRDATEQFAGETVEAYAQVIVRGDNVIYVRP